MARRHTPEEIAATVRDYEKSELTQSEFAAAAGISTGTLCRWRRRRAGGRAAGAPAFIEVALPAAQGGAAPASGYAIEFPRARLELPAGFDPARARALVHILREEAPPC